MKPQEMTRTDCDRVERDTAQTDELLHKDLSVYNKDLGPPNLRLDHCDLLLDAIDAQLGQLQVRPPKRQEVSRSCDCSDTAPLQWSQSLSKDTGLGSTTQTNDTPLSCLDLIRTPSMDQTSERSTSCQEDATPTSDRRTRGREELESQREQVIWRLEKLLGDSCNDGVLAGGSHPLSDSICTEDFVSRFREEMVEVAFPETHIQQHGTEKGSDGAEISDWDCKQNELQQQRAEDVEGRERAQTGRSNKDTETARCSEPKKTSEGEDLGSDSCAVNMSCRGRANAGGRYRTQQELGEDDRAPHRSEEAGDSEPQRQNITCPRVARCLAGVPVRSFDTVSIDSDLDSVCTERVREHIHRRPGWRSLIQSVTGMDDFSSNQSDYDTPTQEDSEAGHSSEKNSESRSSPARKVQRNKRETHRFTSSLDDKDTDEETTPWRSRCRCERSSERTQSDCVKMKERLSILREKCQKEEETLQLKETRLTEAELSFSDLQQRRKNALQDLERLTAETTKMEKERRRLEFVLRGHRAEKDSISQQLQELQRQKAVEPRVVMSVLEREEMDRQLDMAKTELFAEQRRSREKLESLQEKLEETREELQRVTEAESLLRTRCACLEEEQRQKKDRTERGLGECRVRVGTLEKMLAQRELQLLDLKEQRGSLKAERDGLKEALQHLKTQHSDALREAQEQGHKMTTTVQLKDEEVKKLKESLEQQKEEAKRHEEELRGEALEKVHEALEEARGRWEAEKEDAVQEQCAIIEEKNRKKVESVRSELQRERNQTSALQQTVLELKTRVQELESEISAQQREQESLLAVICKSLKEEHQAELQKMQEQMAEESQRAAQRLEHAVQRAEKESDRLRLMLREKESSHHEITAELDQQLRQCTQELAAESQQLLLLVEQSGAQQGSAEITHSSTVAEALANLRVIREQMKHTINHLHQQIDSQKEVTDQLRKSKERELSIQRQQLWMERDHALDSLKERLIQEHIEELSSLNLANICDGGAEGGAAASLRRQLKAKDLELRQVQRSMAQWKEQTAARLACKFEEELTAELERKSSKTREEAQSKPGGLGRNLMCCPEEVQNPVRPPSVHVAAPQSSSDVSSLKLLRYLQSKVKQLRVENQVFTSTPTSSNLVPADPSGSYLSTITRDISGIQSLSSIKTVSS